MSGWTRREDHRRGQQAEWTGLGAGRLRDGLFLGDQLTARDILFARLNKVRLVVNVSSTPTFSSPLKKLDVSYLFYCWSEGERVLGKLNKDCDGRQPPASSENRE